MATRDVQGVTLEAGCTEDDKQGYQLENSEYALRSWSQSAGVRDQVFEEACQIW